MSSSTKEVKISMKVLISKQKQKVIFAEVDADFVDILISFLTLPLGTIVRLLLDKYGDGAPVIGSLNTLYKGLADLDIENFWTTTGKLMLLNPTNPFKEHLEKLKINIDDTEPTKYFICENWNCTLGKNQVSVSMYHETMKCACGKSMNRAIMLSSSDSVKVGSGSGVFTPETASFIISDDLQVFPNLVGSGLQILNNLGFNGMVGVEEITVIVGLEEVMDMLKLSWISKTPLTDIVLHKTKVGPAATVSSGPDMAMGKSCTTSKKMILKAIIQKSTGKVLLAHTREDFIDFVFSLLTIPLGSALSLLGGDISVGSMHNLYRSVASLNGDWYMKTQNSFIKPQLPHKYLSKYQLFIFTETPLYFYYKIIDGKHTGYLTSTWQSSCRPQYVTLMDPKGQGSYVKGPAMFTVTDHLVVSPTSAISGLSILNSLKIPFSDIEEYVVDIGMEEALSILKASLSSTSVLTNGLKPFLKRQPKQEK
ncbi:hypothetical protein ACJIZ3_002531 [Penstemon smallii]|uniref:DUF674 domain-containing protein n=1 Tax=Penstemon smallii TaxID=265156 RepID=A0ABD3U9G6_9LAMI